MRRGAAILLAALAWLTPAGAQDRAGVFDFYVLSLSWSPTYCETEGAGDRAQCGTEAPSGFTVHGLWPQFERGYPESCATDEPLRVPASLAATLSDIMPSRDLVYHQWRRHGTCSGLSQAAYFDEIRAARDLITVPREYTAPAADLQVSARAVEAAFVAANPGLSDRGIAVSCRDGRLAEVRICLSRGLEFRRCGEVDERGCQSRRLAVPVAG